MRIAGPRMPRRYIARGALVLDTATGLVAIVGAGAGHVARDLESIDGPQIAPRWLSVADAIVAARRSLRRPRPGDVADPVFLIAMLESIEAT